MRYFINLFILFLFFSSSSNASSLSTYTASYSGITTSQQSSASTACSKLKGLGGLFPNYSAAGASGSGGGGACIWRTSSDTLVYYGTWAMASTSCPFGDNGFSCNSSCDSPKIMEGGQCITPVNPCTAKKDQQIPYIQKFPSFDAYTSSCTGSVDGCALNTCAGVSSCGTNGETGEFACWGTGKYTGEQQPVADGTASNPPPMPEPTTTDSSQSCTAPAVNDGATTYTCVTDSNATEFSSSNCAVGTVNGVQGLHCTKPDYVPEAATNKRTDVIKTEATADGGTKTTTTSTSENKHCTSGVCTNTTTTTTTTTTKDGAGKVTGETSTCTGAKCEGPTDETKPEEEGMGEAKFSGKGGCEGSDCDVDAFNPFGTDVVPGYSDSLNAALSGIKRSPIGSAVSNIRWPTGGSCPVYSMQLFNSSISVAEHCTVWDSVGSTLRAVFLAIWAFAAVRVFLSA